MFYKLFPGLKQIIEYDRTNLMGDVTAGITVAILLIPQSMAYATIAGVPLNLGLLAASFPVIFYVLFGGSRYLSVGPVSIVSIIAFSGISSLNSSHPLGFLELMVILSLMVGSLQVLWGILKIGSIFNYVSHAVINGFISAAGIIIALNQFNAFFGVSLPAYENLGSFSMEIMAHLQEVNPYTFGIALGSFLFLLLIKKKFPSIPAEFFVIILSVIMVEFFRLHRKGVDIVGHIPMELPSFSINIPGLDTILFLFPIAFVIAFISFIESVAMAKNLASNDNEEIDPNQELRGLGLANIGSSMVGSIPVAGAISRTAVNYHAGARSNLSLIVTALFVLLAILYLTPFFYYIPTATLAAIIIIAIAKLINLGQLNDYLKNKPTDAVIYLATFLPTLMVDIFIGLVVGILISFIINFRPFS